MSARLGDILSVCVSAGVKAGDLISEYQLSGRNIHVEQKSEVKNDFVTVVDTKAQECIFSVIRKEFPSVRIVGEESSDAAATSDEIVVHQPYEDWTKQQTGLEAELELKDVIIYVDPIDSTYSFVKQRNMHQCMVMIGISYRGLAVAGTLHQPLVDDRQTYWGAVGVGSNLSGHPAHALDELTLVGSRRDQARLDLIMAKIGGTVTRLSGAGYKVLAVLTQGFDAYVYPVAGTSKWDTLAPEAILRACGGVLTDMYGDRIEYERHEDTFNGRGVVAAINETVHEHIIMKLGEKLEEA